MDCQPPPPAQEDCLGATTVCSNVAISNNTNNEGNIADIDASNSGCLDTQEYQGTWYIFSPSSSGDLGLSIAPRDPTITTGPSGTLSSGHHRGQRVSSQRSADALCRLQRRCDLQQHRQLRHRHGAPHLLSAPLRQPHGELRDTGDHQHLPPGRSQYCGWVPGLQVTAGQVYLLYISNWTQSSVGFGLDWTLENGASLDCTVLPVELVHFTAEAMGPDALLTWRTASEHGCSHFEVQRSEDAENFGPIGTVAGAGDSQTMQEYTFVDTDPFPASTTTA